METDVHSDDEEQWLHEAEMLQRVQLAKITQAVTLDVAMSRELELAIATSLLPSPLVDGVDLGRAWTIRADATVGRHLVALRALSPDAVVFVESPLVVGQPASAAGESEQRLHHGKTSGVGVLGGGAFDGEMGACALELLRLPFGSPEYAAARLLQSPSIDPEGRSARWLQKAAEQMGRTLLGGLSARGAHDREGLILDGLDDDAGDEQGLEERLRWALGVAMVNAHGAASPARGVVGVLASMMEVRATLRAAHVTLWFPYPAYHLVSS